ncbi:hypothetical protein EVAR_22248_1 [Eumeta japonica]|uniref:Uncharacterized protein n=1 Tax=Eumeta variegata TaxID=151549 RepID=A0A4C1UB88_EUMVA|nr:hypothetical protein EVAR_22248_1 [Eumeta japonica]
MLEIKDKESHSMFKLAKPLGKADTIHDSFSEPYTEYHTTGRSPRSEQAPSLVVRRTTMYGNILPHRRIPLSFTVCSDPDVVLNFSLVPVTHSDAGLTLDLNLNPVLDFHSNTGLVSDIDAASLLRTCLRS